MNLPYFDINRVPINARIGGNWMKSIIDEEKRVCGPIDERRSALAAQFGKLYRETKELERQYTFTRGFFPRRRIRKRMKYILRCLEDIKTMLQTLAHERWIRTY